MTTILLGLAASFLGLLFLGVFGAWQRHDAQVAGAKIQAAAITEAAIKVETAIAAAVTKAPATLDAVKARARDGTF